MLYDENKQHFYRLGLSSNSDLYIKLYETDIPRIIQSHQLLKGFDSQGNSITIDTSHILYAQQLTDVYNVLVFNNNHENIGRFNNVSNVRKVGNRLYCDRKDKTLSQKYNEPFTFKEKLVCYENRV